MASTSETGHAKNVANFQDLIAFAAGYGATYNPTKNSLKLASLNTLSTAAQSNLADVIAKNTDYNNAVNNRLAAFNGIKSLSTRLVSALDATDASPEKIKDAQGFNRKLQGKRATPTATTGPAVPITENTPAPSTISAVQLSYDQQIEHFAGLISVLQSETSYAPNETDLKVVNLIAKKSGLTAKNKDVSTTYAAISNSRIARDKTLYQTDTGLVDIAGEVKKYIKSIYGATSPEYGQVKGIEFKKAKK